MMVMLLYTLFFTGLVLGNGVRITNSNEFSTFVNDVNTGNNYSGTTVYLDSDLSLPGINESIGFNFTYQFSGIFDGQGHIISDLNVNSSSRYAGLFGRSSGLTIRNVILDASCSITNAYKGSSNSLVGGVIGYCSSEKEQCVIENIVNMATVKFNGNINNYTLRLGGIVGYIYSSSYNFTMKNSVNYGEITHSGSSKYSYIGGIVGYFGGSDSYYNYIYNCLNYGTIIYNGTNSESLHLGGIAGYTYYTYIENCVSAGKINTTSSGDIGSIVGYVGSNITINNCYFTEKLSSNDINGNGTNINMLNTPVNSTDVNLTLINNLNNYSTNNGWNKWILNTNNKTVSFIINNGKNLTVNSQIILLFNIIDDERERNFSGWYNDKNLTSPFNSSEVEIGTILYGTFCYLNYTVTLNVNGGNDSSLLSTHPMIIECNRVYGTLPTPEREGYTFTGWFTEKENNKGEKVESGNNVVKLSDHILYAQWDANNYTVAFDATGGKAYVSSKDVTYDSNYGELPTPRKEGYKFIEWLNDMNESVTKDTIVGISNNHTIYAQWEEITVFVEITFGTNDLAEDEIKDIIKQYIEVGGDDFKIVKFESSSDGIKVIIEFKDVEMAENFVELVEASSASFRNYIRKVNFIPESVVSTSIVPYPILLFIVSMVLIMI